MRSGLKYFICFYFILVAILLLTIQLSVAQNPLIKDIGMSDPHVRVFNDTLYLYCGHDDHPDDKTWVMKEWRIFKSTDLRDWVQVGTISPKDNYMDDNSQDCWAGDAINRNGKYYFYFSDRKRGVGVMTSNSPKGPFKDALGKPLVSPMHDPTILIDDDGDKTPYLVYGDKEGGGFHVAKLNEDMISLAEKPHPIVIEGKEWEKAPNWMDKNYIFKHNNTYYLSWGRDYATSDNVYGPYVCKGSVGDKHHLNEFAHGSFFWWKDQFYHVWCYYIRPGYKYRETIISYCHFDDQGNIVTDMNFLDKHFENAVGQYNSSWPKIEAEWYYEKSPEVKKQGNKEVGFKLTDIQKGSWIRFANMIFEKEVKTIQVELSKLSGKGAIEFRLDHLNGPLIGKIKLSEKDGSQPEDKLFSGELKKVRGKRDVYLKFSGNKDFGAHLDYFNFQ